MLHDQVGVTSGSVGCPGEQERRTWVFTGILITLTFISGPVHPGHLCSPLDVSTISVGHMDSFDQHLQQSSPPGQIDTKVLLSLPANLSVHHVSWQYIYVLSLCNSRDTCSHGPTSASVPPPSTYTADLGK